MSASDCINQGFAAESVNHQDLNHPCSNSEKHVGNDRTSILLPPPISFANIYLPPPQGFLNSDASGEDRREPRRDEKPPIPTKPQFVSNTNMNNNNGMPSPMGTLNGTTKLKNLMLLREPTKKPSIRQVFGEDDDSCDSFSDSDYSLDEEESENEISEKEDSISTGQTSTVSSTSTSSYDQITEENKGQYVVAKITIPEQKLSKCMHLRIDETVWSAKQRILQSLVKKLNDPLNYGLFHEKARMFLLDHRPMSEYIEAGSVGSLQMRYKCGKMDNQPDNSKEGRRHSKMQSSSKRRDFLIHVQHYSTDKIYSLIRKGIDPNFQCPSTGETPLTILSSGQSRSECVSVFMALLGGGAHLDYRNKRGFTPMHVAARNGNIQMLKTLIEFKASPNVVDGRDLTPLYHCILLGSDPSAARILLENGATLGCDDSQGWSEIHQACRHGRLQLLELLLTCDNFESDMANRKNASGNTPLHVCALYNQDLCAATLLMHGADASLRNFSNQDAVQVAHVASNVKVAELIANYPDQKDDVKDNLMRARAESYSTKPPIAPRPEQSPKRGKKPSRSTWTPSSFMKHSKHYMLQKQQTHSGTIGRTYTSTMPLENRFDSKLPPNAKIPDVKYPKSTGNGAVDENKVRIVVRNYDAKTSDELSLRVGTRVIVLNARTAPPGYHDGMVGDERGFFPKDCVEEVKLRRPLPDTGQPLPANPYEKHEKASLKKYNSSIDVGVTQRNQMPDSISLVSFDSYEDTHSGSPGRTSSVRSEELAQLQATSTSSVYHNTRNVVLWKGGDGFGFILRGAKSDGPVQDFNPSAKIPGLQYLERVEDGSSSYDAGLRAGDFIIRIGDVDVRKYGHQQLVDTIRACGEPLHMQVTTIVHNTQNGDTASVHSDPALKAVKGHMKTDSITSAIDQLDNVLAMEDYTGDGSEKTASVRRVPGRKIAGDQLQNLFRHNGTVDAVATLPRQPQHSTFSSVKKPIRVLPPSLSNTSTFKYDTSDSRQQEVTRETRSMSAAAYPTWSRASGPPPPPPAEKDYRSRSVSGATGERLLAQSGAKSKKVPPPPPKRMNSRLSVAIPEEETTVKTTPLFISPSPMTVKNTTTPAKPPVNSQSDMAEAIAAAARRRAERASQSEEQKKAQESPPSPPELEAHAVEENHTRSVAEISSAFSLALAAKRKHLDQNKSNPIELKKPSATFTINPTKTPAQRNDERQILPPPPPMSNLPLPPPPSGYNDSSLDLPPPPSFPAPDPHHTQYKDKTFDELIDLPPPPADLLPSPSQGARSSPKISEKTTKPSNLGILPPPPIPPPVDDDDGCTSPTGADNLSNADSGVADVAGDGLNLSQHHRHLSHDHVSGDNHSTVSSLSTTSTMSSEDAGSDFPPPFIPPSMDKQWPHREVRNASSEDSVAKDSGSNDQAGNMYLNVLKKAKSKQQTSTMNSTAADSKKNLRPGITVTKMTFAPVTSLPPPAEETEQKPTKTAPAFPPAPKEYSNVETKPLFGKAPCSGDSVQTKKFGFTPKAAPAPVVKPAVEKTPPKTTPAVAPSAPKTVVNPAASANNNESPVKAVNDSAAKKPLAEWSVSDVCAWLKDLGLAMYVSSFQENEITGEHLPDLGKDELIELGVKPFGHRLTIDRSIKKLAAT